MIMMNSFEATAAPVKFVDVYIMKGMMMAAKMEEMVSTEAAAMHVTRGINNDYKFQMKGIEARSTLYMYM